MPASGSAVINGGTTSEKFGDFYTLGKCGKRSRINFTAKALPAAGGVAAGTLDTNGMCPRLRVQYNVENNPNPDIERGSWFGGIVPGDSTEGMVVWSSPGYVILRGKVAKLEVLGGLGRWEVQLWTVLDGQNTPEPEPDWVWWYRRLANGPGALAPLDIPIVPPAGLTEAVVTHFRTLTSGASIVGFPDGAGSLGLQQTSEPIPIAMASGLSVRVPAGEQALLAYGIRL